MAVAPPVQPLSPRSAADGRIITWDLREEVARWSTTETVNDFEPLAFSSNNTKLIAGLADGTIRILETSTGKAHGPDLIDHFNPASAAAFSCDGESSQLVSAAPLDSIHVWDTRESSDYVWKSPRHHRPPHRVSFFAGGSRVISWRDYDPTETKVWSTGSGKELIMNPYDDEARPDTAGSSLLSSFGLPIDLLPGDDDESLSSLDHTSQLETVPQESLFNLQFNPYKQIFEDLSLGLEFDISTGVLSRGGQMVWKLPKELEAHESRLIILVYHDQRSRDISRNSSRRCFFIATERRRKITQLYLDAKKNYHLVPRNARGYDEGRTTYCTKHHTTHVYEHKPTEPASFQEHDSPALPHALHLRCRRTGGDVLRHDCTARHVLNGLEVLAVLDLLDAHLALNQVVYREGRDGVAARKRLPYVTRCVGGELEERVGTEAGGEVRMREEYTHPLTVPTHAPLAEPGFTKSGRRTRLLGSCSGGGSGEVPFGVTSAPAGRPQARGRTHLARDGAERVEVARGDTLVPMDDPDLDGRRICWILPGTRGFLNFVGRSWTLWGMCHARFSSLRLRIVHLSAALPLVRAAKAAGRPLTAETCFHYLALAADDIPAGHPEFKCCPPVRGAENRAALWAALEDGTIDCVDRKGRLAVGYDADVVVWDPEAESTVHTDGDEVTREGLNFQNKLSAYEGRTLKGQVARTYVGGQLVYERERGFEGLEPAETSYCSRIRR
ncbi:hypothetical protein POSPLADRAFT_1033288 [Postia placenta MAD-698-R-SB12]|uniref:Uncharacterized protein n=1 Tax=Postia placenta MAD-698-R-SB12 TaxID=670580 RepID=A0A1X6N597_9APHY|nr:hypothetical protein POSPLADRAFT_1033288 [Postia placenta MAD-698-R-SB12]OSX63784.1 hypothetical protein POSPLADRAFT_1033288 [Postia placenta MAD-698-R-SB12]